MTTYLWLSLDSLVYKSILVFLCKIYEYWVFPSYLDKDVWKLQTLNSEKDDFLCFGDETLCTNIKNRLFYCYYNWSFVRNSTSKKETISWTSNSA